MKNTLVQITLAFCVLVIVSCTPSSQNEYDNTVIDLGLGFTAKQMCSCLFVVEQSEEFCREFVKIKQVDPKITVHDSHIESRLFLIFSAKANYLGPDRGCVLE